MDAIKDIQNVSRELLNYVQPIFYNDPIDAAKRLWISIKERRSELCSTNARTAGDDLSLMTSLSFCPYCGKMLDGSTDTSQASAGGSDLAQAIDSIWGEKARLKSEFSRVISQCIYSINNYAENGVAKTLPKQDLSKYDKHYSAIKQSNNRKTLISRIDGFIDSLDNVIDNLSDRIPADTSSRLENAVYDVDEMVKELYDFWDCDIRHLPLISSQKKTIRQRCCTQENNFEIYTILYLLLTQSTKNVLRTIICSRHFLQHRITV